MYEGDRVFVDIRGHSQITERAVTVGIRITDELGLEVYGVNTQLLGTAVSVRAGEDFDLTFDFEMRLSPGTYRLTTAIHAGDDHLHKCYHWIDNALSFECRRSDAPSFSGLVNLQAQVSGRVLTASVL
jgi:lipopolysaccharide transport system ATP-binding protein